MTILFPDNWMKEITPFIDQDNDFTLIGSISQMHKLPDNVDYSKLIVYNWDHYSWIDMTNRGDWRRFHALCRKAAEVWIPTHAHASYFKRDTGIDSYVLNLACVDPQEFNGSTTRGNYIMMSSRKDWYKRFAMFEQACQELGMPYKATHPETTSRKEYIDLMKGCRGYVQASIDESLGGLSLMEAVWNDKPVLMSDSIAGGREVYGDTISYFSAHDYKDLKAKLTDLWESHGNPDAFDRIKNQTPEGVALQINSRICQLRSTLQAQDQ